MNYFHAIVEIDTLDNLPGVSGLTRIFPSEHKVAARFVLDEKHGTSSFGRRGAIGTLVAWRIVNPQSESIAAQSLRQAVDIRIVPKANDLTGDKDGSIVVSEWCSSEEKDDMPTITVKNIPESLYEDLANLPGRIIAASTARSSPASSGLAG